MHYHGTPITPIAKLYEMAGRCFCVSFMAPGDIRRVHDIGQSVMLDNGAFSAWRSGKPVNWPGYYQWCEPWLDCSTTWAVIPDVIVGDDAEQDALIDQWPHGAKGAPVWHMHETIDRLLRLTEEWPRVCIGSSGDFATVLDDRWRRRMDEAWNVIARHHRRTPYVHMLRGMATLGKRWPFASVDSTDIARNHNRPHNSPRAMADRWDRVQCPVRFIPQHEQMELIA